MIWRTCPLGLMAAVLALAAGGCENGSTGPAKLVTASGRSNGEIPLTDENRVIVGNRIGPVILQGEGLGALARWSLHKLASAPTGEEARALLDDIQLDQMSEDDTLRVRVTSPLNSATVVYESGLHVSVPFTMACTIDEARSEIRVADLFAELVIAEGPEIVVERHNGSCEIAAESDVTAEVAIPESGTCRIATIAGDVSLRVPTSTSASVVLSTGDGEITISGLTLSGGETRPNLVTGTLGTGGEIRVQTDQGDVDLIGF